MLDSMKITRRQSEIRQSLAELAAKPEPSEDEVRSMETLDAEYRTNETRYRAALTAEDTERREAGEELETRSGREWGELLAGFEVRQAVAALDTGAKLTGRTAEAVEELRGRAGFQGIPVPLEALETRAGETVASGTPAPTVTAPIIDRLFAQSVASRMGARMINVGVGEREYPVATSGAVPGWAGSETGDVPGPQVYATTDKPLRPDHTLGVQMQLTRKAMLQSGAGLEAAVRRDMGQAIRVETDRATFLGTGAGGEPLGVIAGAATYGITETAVDAAATYGAFRAAAVRFIERNAAAGLGGLNLLLRPEVMDAMDDAAWDAGSGVTEWDRLTARMGNVVLTPSALDAPTGASAESTALLTTATAGVDPIFVGMWGAVDLIRDTVTKAASGQLVLTALLTMDVTVARPAQLEVLTGVQG